MHRKKQCQLRVPAQIATKTCQSQNLSKTSKTDRNNRPEIRDGPPFSEVVVNCCSLPCYLRQRKTHQRLAVGEIGWPKQLQAAQGRSRSEPQYGKDMETENLSLRLRLVGTPYLNTFYVKIETWIQVRPIVISDYLGLMWVWNPKKNRILTRCQ